jgi:hypothetical protein
MRTIWKTTLLAVQEQHINLPEGAEFLHVGEQHGNICIWSSVNPVNPSKLYTVYLYPTGFSYADDPACKHLGTVIAHGGSLVWHIFYRE